MHIKNGERIVFREERWKMYFDIHQLKQMGLKVAQIARKAGVSRGTVYKYLAMTPEDYQHNLEGMDTRRKKLDHHHDHIVSWLRAYPDLSAAQVMDWLEERNLISKKSVGESTVRNYVRQIRKRYEIPKQRYKRDYEAVPDPPMGQQMQADFGQTQTSMEDGQPVKLWFITFVLSHSRYKYVQWQETPFTTMDVIAAHEQVFEYFEGVTKEIVYDQDSLMLVSENHGDLIYTQAFATYVKERKFQVYMCRKADPESKGRIENVVKYVKYNFGRHRTFTNIYKWQEACLAWLARTGNSKKHETTKKIPHEVFQEEQHYLRPVKEKIIHTNVTQSITRVVRKDNTISYQSNRYSVPLGTYNGQNKEVGVRVQGHELMISDANTGQEICRHEWCTEKGQLIQNSHHRRDRSRGIDAYIQHVANTFPDPEQAMTYLQTMRSHKRRYIRDQLQIMLKSIGQAPAQSVGQALDYCVSRNLYQGTDFVAALQYFAGKVKADESIQTTVQAVTNLPWQASIKPEIRDMNVYQSIMKGDAYDASNRATQTATKATKMVGNSHTSG
jgi:transposase